MSDNTVSNNEIINTDVNNEIINTDVNEIPNTDIETLLQMKKKIEIIIQSLEYIHESGIELNNPSEDPDNQDNTSDPNEIEEQNELSNKYYKKIMEEFPVIRQRLQSIINILNNEIRNTCEHCFENDYIDIFPENSIPIKYCIKCYLTF